MVSVARWLGQGVLIAFASCATHTHATAGAWLQAAGKTQIIFTGSWTESTRRFDQKSRPRPSGHFARQELNAVSEYGWSDTLAVIGGVQAKHLSTPPNNSLVGNRGHMVNLVALGGVKFKLWSNGQTILSVQGTLQGSAERSLLPGQRKTDAPAEADIRLLAGYAFNLGAVPAFVDVQSGYRWRGGANADSLHFDATIGARPLPHLLVLLQSFNTVAVVKDRRFGGGRSAHHKLQASVVYDLNERWSLQGGVFSSVKGRETIQERGALLAVWRRL